MRSELDIYEGMWRVFQQVPGSESKVAIAKSAAFINKHLQGWNMIWRIYGPTKPWYDRSWKIGDPEVVK